MWYSNFFFEIFFQKMYNYSETVGSIEKCSSIELILVFQAQQDKCKFISLSKIGKKISSGRRSIPVRKTPINVNKDGLMDYIVSNYQNSKIKRI